MSFQLNINHSQRRLAADRLTVVAGGLEFNGAIWENTWIDPITHTLMLRPRPLKTQWYTDSTGDYTKLSLADFDTDASWEERSDQHWAGPWLAVKDAAMNPAALSMASYPKNMGLSFSWLATARAIRFCSTNWVGITKPLLSQESHCNSGAMGGLTFTATENSSSLARLAEQNLGKFGVCKFLKS